MFRCSTDDSLLDMHTFSNVVDNISFLSKAKVEVQTLLFRLDDTKYIFKQVVSDRRNPSNTAGEQISQEMLLKQAHNKVNEFYVVKIPYSGAIVESLGSVTEIIVRNKVALKSPDLSDTVDITETSALSKLVGPSSGTTSNRKLYKGALMLMFDAHDYAKYFKKPQRISFKSGQFNFSNKVT